MHLPLLTLGLSASLATATNLYVTHYSGTVYTLSLHGSDLSISSSLKTCGSMPSWLTFDSGSRTLYCLDETGDAKTKGSLTTLSAAGNGSLAELAKTSDIGGGVSSVFYGEKQFLAVAHYAGSAVSTFKLPIKNNEPNLQTFSYHAKGPKPQQDASHVHEVILDPSGSFILAPDLGADVAHVFSIDQKSGKLSTCPSLNFTAGSGPRHGVFKPTHTPGHGKGSSLLYLIDELDGHLHVFTVSQKDGCLAFQEIQSMVPYPGGKLPNGATPSEIRVVGKSVYVSIRTDHAFPPNDSIASLTRAENGTVSFRELTSSYGTVPRTFVVNKAGDLLAIGNQASSNVAVVRRDPKTGKLGAKVANVQVGEPGQVGTSTGLSSVVWDE